MNETRSPKFPGVPTLKEAGYDFVNDAVYAILGPSDLPGDVVIKLEKIFSAAMDNREYLEALDRLDLAPLSFNGAQFETFLRRHWEKINRHLIGSGLIKKAATPLE
jgi:tripartite-type tricarboxylate transporter receptor subunit TctC